MTGNCFVWAVRHWVGRGGYLVVRKSDWGWWPHFLWSPDLSEFTAFEPLAPRRRLMPKIWFRGEVNRNAR